MRPVSSALAKSITASGHKTVAVVDFTDLQGNVTELGRFLSEELSVQLVADAKGFEVIERTQLKVILQEHQLSSTGLIDPQTAKKLGKIAGVDALIMGTITALGDVVRLSAKIVDTQTAKMIGATTYDIAKTRAVEDLLQRGIGGTTGVRTESGMHSTPAQNSAPISAAVIFTAKGCWHGDYRIELAFTPKKCHHQKQITICSVELVNKDVHGIDIDVDHEASSLVDDRGDQYKLDRLVIGQKQTLHLEPEIPITLAASAEGVSNEASRMHVLLRFVADGCPRDIAIRNIPIEQH